MSVIKEPVMLDRTGRELIEVGKSIAAALWAEKSTLIPSKDVNLYDYDGTIVYSYTRAEFLGLDALPAFPAHDGLTAQGWNWALADAKAHVQKYTYLDIGVNYITDDGKTRLYVEIGYPENLTITINYVQSAGSTVTIDWGDGNTETTEVSTVPSGESKRTHTYAEQGRYVVTLDISEEGTLALGTGTGTGTTLSEAGGLSKAFFWQGGQGRIAGKDALLALEIGNGVTAVRGGALAFSTRLKYITVPTTCTTFGDLSLCGCFKLQAVVYPTGVTRIGNMTHLCNYDIKVICLPSTVTALGTSVFKTCTELRRMIIPEGVTAIPNYAFAGLHTATIISLPDTIAGTLGNYAFHCCYCLEEMNIPVGITAIGTYAFSQCHNLRKIELPEGLTTIGAHAFTSCFGFKDFVIPSTVTSIGAFAFLYNDGCNEFHVKAETPPTLEPTAFTAIGGVNTVIYVPYSEDHSILAAYLAATGWSSKGDYIQEEVEA